MNEGLLWYDETRSKPLPQVIQEASRRYLQRFGQVPNLAWVNQGEVAQAGEIEGMRVQGRTHVPKRHVWVGVQQ